MKPGSSTLGNRQRRNQLDLSPARRSLTRSGSAGVAVTSGTVGHGLPRQRWTPTKPARHIVYTWHRATSNSAHRNASQVRRAP